MMCAHHIHTREMHAREIHAHEIHAHEVHAREMHVYEIDTYEMHAREMHAHGVHACETHAHDMHAYEMHAHEVYPHEMHAYEMHAHKTHAYEIHALEMYARKVLEKISRSPTLQTVVRWSICRDLSCKMVLAQLSLRPAAGVDPAVPAARRTRWLKLTYFQSTELILRRVLGLNTQQNIPLLPCTISITTC